MIKKAMFSILLASAFSFVAAQETVKTNKPLSVELNPDYRYNKADNRSVKIKAEPVSTKGKNVKNSEQPTTELKPVKVAAKPMPVKVTTNNKK